VREMGGTTVFRLFYCNGRDTCQHGPIEKLEPPMGTKTTFICDCCLREADSNLGWARVHINGASGDKQLLPDDARDLCEICWSPLQVLMKKVHAEARARRSSSSGA
jgi:hypothetical protein